MKVEKINESLYLTNMEKSAPNTEVKKQMFSADFNPDDGIQVEKQTQKDDKTPKTYTKKSKDECGNDMVLTYRNSDNALLSREIKYSYGYERTEYIKPGTNIIQKALEKNSDGVVILEENYYEESPFGKKEAIETDPQSGEISSMYFYENGEEQPYFKVIYDRGCKIEETLKDGEPEETTVYRDDGSIEQHIEPFTNTSGQKQYHQTLYREDGTVFSQGIYVEPYAVLSIEETNYACDGETVIAKKYIKDSLTYHDNYNDDGSVRVREIYDSAGSRMRERIVYDANGEEYIHTKYGSNGEITEYTKNENSVANQPFQEKLLNGKIDTSFKQGQAGTCYIASTVRSMLSTPEGREILSNTIKYNPDNNTSTITFKGVNKEYTFTKEEIEKAMGRLGTGDPDFTAFLLGYEQYRTEELHRTVDGGLGTEVMQVLTGQEGDTNIMFNLLKQEINNDVLDQLQKAMETKSLVLTAGTPPRELHTEFSEKDNKMGLANSHAYCVKQITPDSVYLIEPTTDKEIKISRELFIEKFDSYFVVELTQEQ